VSCGGFQIPPKEFDVKKTCRPLSRHSLRSTINVIDVLKHGAADVINGHVFLPSVNAGFIGRLIQNIDAEIKCIIGRAGARCSNVCPSVGGAGRERHHL